MRRLAWYVAMHWAHESSIIENRGILDLATRVPHDVVVLPRPIGRKYDYAIIDARMTNGCRLFMLHSRLGEDVKRIIWQHVRQYLIETRLPAFGDVKVLKQARMPQTLVFRTRNVPDVTTVAFVTSSGITLFHLAPADVFALTCNAHTKRCFCLDFHSATRVFRKFGAFISHTIPLGV